jgi:hypothetical protein
VETTETRFHAERYHGDLSPILGGVVPPSNFRVRLPNGGGDIQLMSTQLVQQLGRTTLTLGKIDTGDLLASTRSTTAVATHGSSTCVGDAPNGTGQHLGILSVHTQSRSPGRSWSSTPTIGRGTADAFGRRLLLRQPE